MGHWKGMDAHVRGSVRVLTGFTHVITLMIAALVLAFGVTMIGSSTYAKPGDTEKYDFYTLSSNVTAYFSDAVKPGAKTGLSANEGWTTIAQNPSEGGDFLGYGDDNISSFTGWLVSKTTGASNTVGYDSLRTISGNSDGNKTSLQGALGYAQYGSLLNAMGLDSTSTGIGLHLENMIFGFVMMLLYLLAGGIDTIFSAVVWILDLLNPFRMFFQAVSVSSVSLADGMTDGQGVPVWMQSLSTWVSDWYQVLVNMSWTVLMPLFLITFVTSAFLWKKGQALSGLKKLLVRVVFLAFGLPLIGSLYTATLSTMKDASAGAGMGATRVVVSTFVDFENWAKHSRLAVPEGATLAWDSLAQAPTGYSVNKLRQTTAAINGLAQHEAFKDVSSLGVSSLGSITAEAAKADESQDSGVNYTTYGATMGMLLRYATAQRYEASDFETAIKGMLGQAATSNSDNGTLVKSCATTWFGVQTDGSTKADESGGNQKCDKLKASDNPVLTVAPNSGLKADLGETGSVYTFTTPKDSNSPNALVVKGGERVNANLSALSMYNYLNTAFDKNALTVYSSSNAVSQATREYHASVNLVGSSGVNWLYWLNASTTLFCFVVLGLGYALGMLTGAVRNTLRIITAVPFATLGSLAAIAKVLIYTFTMITEIIGTMFIYRLVQEFIVSVPSIFEGGLEHMYNSLGGFGDYLRNSGYVTLFTAIVSTIVLLMLTVKMMHFRGAFVKGLNEAVTKIVDKFLDVNVLPPGGGVKGMPLMSGVGAGVGSAAANRLMSGRGGLGSTSAARDGIASGLGVAGGAAAGGSSINGTDNPDEAGPGALGAGPSSPGGSGSGGIASRDEGLSAGGASAALTTSASDRQLAREVDSRGGLSEPRLEAGPKADTKDAAASSTVANGEGDGVSAFAGSIGQSMEIHAQADKARRAQAVSGIKAAYHGTKAAARASAGDVGGALQDGQKAMSSIDEGKRKGQEARALRQSANAPRPASAQSQVRQAPVQPARQGRAQAPAPQQAPQQVSARQAPMQQPAAPARGRAPRLAAQPSSPQAPASPHLPPTAPRGGTGMKPGSGGLPIPPVK